MPSWPWFTRKRCQRPDRPFLQVHPPPQVTAAAAPVGTFFQRRPHQEASMKALCWHGKNDVRVETVPDPKIEDPRDAIVRSPRPPSAASDLHLTTATSRRWSRATSSATSSWARSSRSGRGVKKLKVGDRVVVPFTIACGELLLLRAAALVAAATTPTPTPGWPRS